MTSTNTASGSVADSMSTYTDISTISVDAKLNVRVGTIITLDEYDWWHLPFDTEVLSVSADLRQRTILTLKRESLRADGDTVAGYSVRSR